MKTIEFISRRWDEEKQEIVEHALSFKVGDKTARMVIDDLTNNKMLSPFTTTYVEGQDMEFRIKDENDGYIYEAVRL